MLILTSTIFITGAGGFIGRAVCRVAKTSDGPEVVSVPQRGAPEFLRSQLVGKRSNATVLHLAWPNLGSSRTGELLTPENWQEFLAWSLSLRAAVAAAGARFIGVGSGIEACAAQLLTALGEPYLTYARRKAQLMTTLLGIDSPGMSWVRLHFMFGPFENSSRFVPAAIRACLDGTQFCCGRRDRRRHWLHVDDVARFLISYAAADVAGTWDIAGRQAMSFDDMIELIERAVGRPLWLSAESTGAADDMLDAVVPVNLSPIVPDAAGRPANLLAGLTEYTHWIKAGRMGDGQRTSS